jgi:hypothetical protein
MLTGWTVIVWALWGAPALAQTPAPSADEQAHVLFLNGQRLYDEGRYEEAVQAFQTAYDLSKRPLMLFNMANAYERLGQLEQAIDTLNHYRVYADPSEQDVLLARVQTIERRLAAQRQAAPAPVPAPLPAPGPSPGPVPRDAAGPAGSGPTVQRRSLAPWVLAVGGGVVALGGTGVAAYTWSNSRPLLESGDEAGWQRLRPANNAGVASALVGGATCAVGLTWAGLRGPAD